MQSSRLQEADQEADLGISRIGRLRHRHSYTRHLLPTVRTWSKAEKRKGVMVKFDGVRG